MLVAAVRNQTDRLTFMSLPDAARCVVSVFLGYGTRFCFLPLFFTPFFFYTLTEGGVSYRGREVSLMQGRLEVILIFVSK